MMSGYIGMRGTERERFAAKYRVTAEGCWQWAATLNQSGYGVFWAGGKNVKAHRFSYETFVGPIEDGMTIDHLCRNRACVRPDHLEKVTHQENVKRGLTSALKTHCAQGHPWTEENIRLDNRGARFCLPCKRKAGLAYYRKKRREVRK